MSSMQLAEKFNTAFHLAREDAWDHPVPKVPLRLGILLRMLGTRIPSYWEKDPEYCAQALFANSEDLALKLDEFDPLTLGFAMRTQRFLESSRAQDPR